MPQHVEHHSRPSKNPATREDADGTRKRVPAPSRRHSNFPTISLHLTTFKKVFVQRISSSETSGTTVWEPADIDPISEHYLLTFTELRPVLLRPGFYLGQFYLGQVYLGQVRLRPNFCFFQISAIFWGCWCGVVVLLLWWCVLCVVVP